METQQPKIGPLVTAAIRLPWYMFKWSVKTIFAALKWMKLPEKKSAMEPHRMSQVGANEYQAKQMA